MQSSPASEITFWANSTKEQLYASLPVYDMFPLSDWQNNVPLTWYAFVRLTIYVNINKNNI
jgi:hypothetical protein